MRFGRFGKNWKGRNPSTIAFFGAEDHKSVPKHTWQSDSKLVLRKEAEPHILQRFKADPAPAGLAWREHEDDLDSHSKPPIKLRGGNHIYFEVRRPSEAGDAEGQHKRGKRC